MSNYHRPGFFCMAALLAGVSATALGGTASDRVRDSGQLRLGYEASKHGTQDDAAESDGATA